jgi:hypothetical protein
MFAPQSRQILSPSEGPLLAAHSGRSLPSLNLITGRRLSTPNGRMGYTVAQGRKLLKTGANENPDFGFSKEFIPYM